MNTTSFDRGHMDGRHPALRIISRYDLAHAAGWDAGNDSMYAAGRSRWSQEDYDACWRKFREIMPEESS